ncbi:hypothetical protein SAPIO_CDS2638 [Scedosporium apiospermum]|uniref:AMP-activated protein kinase glycogen-binding domain-containing protein n=1 Tax=Pseudallescheria apiosperma TaxID=563466 RepID=A0A084GCX2_PSEDA|nr:uncharacterized protein SAPIO_CDS2638 [Scedosporium apiospermum]KEZ45184.1 hypothetical protein SAPIO_CDS2638 [Scedosporium apiospermum]
MGTFTFKWKPVALSRTSTWKGASPWRWDKRIHGTKLFSFQRSPAFTALALPSTTLYQLLTWTVSVSRNKPAQEVYVTGTFDNWSKSEKLDKIGDDSFTKTVAIPDASSKIYYKCACDEAARSS